MHCIHVYDKKKKKPVKVDRVNVSVSGRGSGDTEKPCSSMLPNISGQLAIACIGLIAFFVFFFVLQVYV